MFYEISLSPQVKQWVSVTYKHDILKLPHNVPYDLRLRILRNYEVSEKCLKFIE